ncbi:hypothetical protein [Amycolatopsis plumensis]|uniref:Uncharacterized protein n=1 Tax=Amycolatopsis plumensis TaxID=236508 RepID=A0ABV5TXS6_9PSEU
MFDPRGLDVTCPAPAPLPGPLTMSAYEAYAAANAKFAADCPAARSRLGADQVARDMDVIRARLGERRLNYFGSSYGTVYEQEYAALFGARVGRMYLDSVLDHTRRDPAAWTRAGAETAEHNLVRMARWCAAEAGCALHGRDVIAVWDGLLATPDAPAIVAWAAARIGTDSSWPALLVDAVRAAARGQGLLDPQVTRRTLRRFAEPTGGRPVSPCRVGFGRAVPRRVVGFGRAVPRRVVGSGEKLCLALWPAPGKKLSSSDGQALG